MGAEAPSTTLSTEVEKGAEDRDAVERAKDVVVPHWFTSFFNAGVVSVIGLNTVTLVSGSANLLFARGLRGSRKWYVGGLTAAVAHYAFVPLVAASVRGLVCLAAGGRKAEVESGEKEKGVDGKAVGLVREWVWFHTVRMCSVDLVAWACFARAVAESVTVLV